MDLDSFISRYGSEWRALEQACSRGPRSLKQRSGADISETIQLYLRASSHLAEVQTRYRDPHLEAYLVGLVARAHASIYGTRPASLRASLELFGSRYRRAIRRTAPFIWVAAAVLAAVSLAVWLWVVLSPEAEAGIVPPLAREAVREMTGKVELDPSLMSSAILVNNVSVAILAFALGITFGAGTIYVLALNAVMIGSLAGAAHAAGKAGLFWSLVLPHGFLELTAIAIAAGAGLRLGWSLIDPGDERRIDAMTGEARDVVLVVLGVVPAFVVAALIEGFITGSNIPSAIQIVAGALIAAGYVAFLFGGSRAAPEP